jgi:hypothetical protein
LGFDSERSVFAAIALAPIFFWELSVGVWMTFKGFNASALAALGFDEGETDPPAPARSQSAIADGVA